MAAYKPADLLVSVDEKGRCAKSPAIRNRHGKFHNFSVKCLVGKTNLLLALLLLDTALCSVCAYNPRLSSRTLRNQLLRVGHLNQ